TALSSPSAWARGTGSAPQPAAPTTTSSMSPHSPARRNRPTASSKTSRFFFGSKYPTNRTYGRVSPYRARVAASAAGGRGGEWGGGAAGGAARSGGPPPPARRRPASAADSSGRGPPRAWSLRRR